MEKLEILFPAAGEKPKEKKEKETPWQVAPYEKAWIRSMDLTLGTDDRRIYQEMDRDPSTLKFMVGEPMTEEDLDSFAVENNDPGKERIIYAVTSEKSQGKKMEGWVMLYPEGAGRIEEVSEKGFYDFPPDANVIEVSYARYLDKKVADEEKERGLISSALRQVCYTYGLIDEEIISKIKTKKTIAPKIFFVAYTDPANSSSDRLLDKSLFEKRGQLQYDVDSEKLDDFWVLDWEKLFAYFGAKDEAQAEEMIRQLGAKNKRYYRA